MGAAGLLLAFAGTEIAVPPLASDRLRDDLARSGEVVRVEVDAFPAVRLLLGKAGRVEVEMGAVRTGPGGLADLLARTADAGEIDATARTLHVGPLVAREAKLTKRGERLDGEAAVTEADLTAALPPAIGLRPIPTDDGQLVLEATAPVFGQRVAVRARLSARDGALVVAPEGILGAFGTLTVFRDPRVTVTAVGARPRGDGFVVTAKARV